MTKTGPLSLTDVVIGPDGHMYFCAGGRNQQSYLYRVYYKGNESTELSKLDQTGAERGGIADFVGYDTGRAYIAARSISRSGAYQ